MKYNFSEWLNEPISENGSVTLAGKDELLSLYITDTLKEIRTSEGITKKELAQRMNTNTATVLMLESVDYTHPVECILNYLHNLGAELNISITYSGKEYKLSEFLHNVNNIKD
jgi:transcriptional regulator with XRE-family HTH domain